MEKDYEIVPGRSYEVFSSSKNSAYKEFWGNYIATMHALKEEGRVPLTVRHIAEKRLEAVASGDEQVMYDWLENWFSTASAIASFNDEIKVIPNCDFLVNINSDEKIRDCSITLANRCIKSKYGLREEQYGYLENKVTLTEELYNSLNGKVFKRSDLKLNETMKKNSVKAHPVWKELLGDILEPYVNMIFKITDEKHGFDLTMGVYVPESGEPPELFPFKIDAIYCSEFLTYERILESYSCLAGIKS